MGEALRHYVPVLRAREGELRALERTESDVHKSMTPLVEVHARALNADDKPTREVEEHLATIATRLVGARRDRSVFFDPWPLIHTEALNPAAAVRQAAQAARDAELHAIPVTAPGRGGAYQAQVAEAVRDGAGRMCVRLTAERYGDAATLPRRLDALLKRCGVERGQVDMVLDMGGEIQRLARAMLSWLPYRDDWGTLTLIAGGFPQSLSDIPGLARIPRPDWQLWQQIRADDHTLTDDEDDDGGIVLSQRSARFGDYGPRAAASADAPYRPAPNLRYTLPEDWLIVRGTGGPAADPAQIYELCRRIVDIGDEWRGRDYSWGDEWIFDRSAGIRPGPGSPTTWITVALTHHLKVVTEQLSTLGGP